MLGRADHVDLPNVVHNRKAVKTDVFGELSDFRELRGELGWAARPCEIADVQT